LRASYCIIHLTMADKKDKDQAFTLVNTLAPLPETKRGYATHMYAVQQRSSKKDKFIYTNGRCVVIRELASPDKATTFTEHKVKVNCAAFSPSGEWVASGDSEGKVLIWGADTMIVKNTVECGKSVNDIAWDSEGKRICAVGDGNENKARVFAWDTGNAIGTIEFHSQPILSVSIRPTKPGRIVTGSEDLNTNIYEGPPFKFLKTNTKHTRYPNVTRYSPNGETYISVGSDQLITQYNGTTGEVLKQINAGEAKEGHKGAIFSFAWSPDSKQILTASADKTAKLWDVESGAVVKTFTCVAKPEVTDMLVGALWHGEYVLVLALSGAIHYLDLENPAKPKRTLHGHKDNLMGFAMDRRSGASGFYVSDLEGHISFWDQKSGTATWFSGKGHDKTIPSIALSCDGKTLASVGLDDKIRFNETEKRAFNSSAIGLGGKPEAVAMANKTADLCAVVLATQKLLIFRKGSQASATDLGFVPTAVAFSPDDTEIIVGGKNAKLVFYGLDKDTPKMKASPEGPDKNVTAVVYSSNGAFAGCVDSSRRISVFETKDPKRTNRVDTGWCFHNSVVTDLAFSPKGDRLATCSNDESVIVWTDLAKWQDTARLRVDAVHCQGVTHVDWIGDSLITTGSDRCIKFWNAKAQ